MKNSQTAQIARQNFQNEAKKCYYGPWKIPTYSNLDPNKGILQLLNIIKKNPERTRNEYKILTGKSLSANTFQDLLWGKLITPRKYKITQLGLDLLAEYGL